MRNLVARMHRVIRLESTGFLFLCVLAAAPALSQTINQKNSQLSPADFDADNTLRVNSDLVQLDVVVNDKKGNPVAGLQKSDLKVYEDNLPQKILSFEYTDAKNSAALSNQQVHSMAELDRTESDAPVSIIVLDEVTTKFQERYFARYSLKKYLGKESGPLVQPMMLVARNLDRIMVLCDFTTSKKDILSALDRHLAGSDWKAENPNYTSEQFLATFASLMEIAKATQGHAGHKNLIWIGRGLPSIDLSGLSSDDKKALEYALAKCTNLLKDARITLYSVDPAGIAVSTAVAINGDGSADYTDFFQGDINFEKLVRATGGQALHGRNDVDQMIATSVRNGESFYTISYRPSSVSDDKPMKFRKIRVVPVNSDYVAISRAGYYLAPPEKFAADKNLSGSAQDQENFDISAASSNLMVFDGIPLQISKDATAPDLYHLSFPANRLGLNAQNGKDSGNIQVILLGYGRTGKLLSKNAKTLLIQLNDLNPGLGENRVVTIKTPLKMPADTARVRLIVRAENSGFIGADNIYLVDRKTLKDPITGLKTAATDKR